jgi:peptidoglycan/LPS O-acetylase OafA/YrhL
MSVKERVPELDGIRGLAILLVVVCHYVQNPLLAVSGWWPKYIAKSLSLTWSGVDLFFVLSGFLICGILVDNRDSPTYFRTFYARRTTRIFPLYFLILGLFVVLRGSIPAPRLFDNAMPLWTYATFTQNIAMVPHPEGTAFWLGVTWSLAVEEQFYLVLPLIVYVVPRRSLLPLFAVCILGAVCLRIFFPGHRAYLLTPWRADSLLSGASVALLIRSAEVRSWLSAHRRLLLCGFSVLLAGAAAMIAKPWSPWARCHIWLALLFAALLLVTLTNSIPLLNRVLSAAGLRWLGLISYGVYLLHGPVSGLLHWYIAGTGMEFRTPTDIAVTALSVVVTLALASLSFRYFETPFLRLGQKCKYAPAAAASVQFAPNTVPGVQPPVL